MRTSEGPARSAGWAIGIVAAGLLLLAGTHGDARAQSTPTYDLQVQRSAAARLPLELAPPRVESSSPAASGGALEMANRLVTDLVYSGLFTWKDPLPGGIVRPAHAPDAWRADASAPAAGRVELTLSGVREDQMVLVARVVEPEAGTQLVGRRYVVDLRRPERQVHHLADEIVRVLTGETGVAQTRILFSRKSGEGRELFLVDYDGENLRQITRNGSLNLLPRWSPDSESICYTSYWQGRQRLLVLDGRSGESRRIAEFAGLNYGADFAPNGRELVVTLSRDGNPEIYRLGLDGKVIARLTFERSIECSPVFDPTGHQIAFTSDRTGVPQIYAMTRDGTDRRRLTYEGSYNDGATWSPRGDRIAYVSRREGRFQIFTVEPDGSNLQPITLENDGNNEDPSWAPDGRHLVVASDRDGSRRLWILDTDSGAARPLTRGRVDDNGPHWSAPPSRGED